MAQIQPDIWIILVAGGSGARFGSFKQFADISGKTVLEWSLKAALSITPNLVVVLPHQAKDSKTKNQAAKAPKGSTSADNLQDFLEDANPPWNTESWNTEFLKNAKPIKDAKEIFATTGGTTRSESVRAGLKKIESMGKLESAEIILIHDVVRPLADRKIFSAVIEAVQNGADAAVPAISANDTVHTTSSEILDRQSLLLLQTPQAFKAEVIYEIHKSNPEATDDVSLCIKANKKVEYIKGSSQNLKITTAEDLPIAEALLINREDNMKASNQTRRRKI